MNSQSKLLSIILLVGACGVTAIVTPIRTTNALPGKEIIDVPGFTPREERPAWADAISAGTRAERPNILFVVFDARRRDDFSFGPFGNTRGDTPFLSAFKDDAIYFEDAVSPGCWTVPVHASMFSGLTVFDLGIDLYQAGFASFSDRFLSLAEILRVAGYHTIAYPDHPYFYISSPYYKDNVNTSLIRGFEHFNVIGDFTNGYGSYTNVGTKKGRIVHRYELTDMPDMSLAEMKSRIQRFNSGALRFDLRKDADYDSSTGFYFAKLHDMYRRSDYFQKRYGKGFDNHLFKENGGRPFFLFLNLHMCTIARPDPALWTEWYLTTLMLNAQVQGKRLTCAADVHDTGTCLSRNRARLGIEFALRLQPEGVNAGTILKHIYDNRFYDANFRAVWEYLEEKSLDDHTVAIITSDHGMSFCEHGESFYLHGGAMPHENIVRVPVVIRFPKTHELAGLHGRYAQRVSLVDLFMTTVDLGLGKGVFHRSLPVRGKSLVDRLVQKDFPSIVYAESVLRPDSYTLLPGIAGFSRAIYENGTKLMYQWGLCELPHNWPLGKPLPEKATSAETLALMYDVDRDPGEKQNIAAQAPALLARMLSHNAAVPAAALDRPTSAAPVWDQDALDTLNALGYVGHDSAPATASDGQDRRP